MKQKNTASDLLAQIEIDFFEGVNLAAASRLQGGERRTFTLSQVERLLTEENGILRNLSVLQISAWQPEKLRAATKVWYSAILISTNGLKRLPIASIGERQQSLKYMQMRWLT